METNVIVFIYSVHNSKIIFSVHYVITDEKVNVTQTNLATDTLVRLHRVLTEVHTTHTNNGNTFSILYVSAPPQMASRYNPCFTSINKTKAKKDFVISQMFPKLHLRF